MALYYNGFPWGYLTLPIGAHNSIYNWIRGALTYSNPTSHIFTVYWPGFSGYDSTSIPNHHTTWEYWILNKKQSFNVPGIGCIFTITYYETRKNNIYIYINHNWYLPWDWHIYQHSPYISWQIWVNIPYMDGMGKIACPAFFGFKALLHKSFGWRHGCLYRLKTP